MRNTDNYIRVSRELAKKCYDHNFYVFLVPDKVDVESRVLPVSKKISKKSFELCVKMHGKNDCNSVRGSKYRYYLRKADVDARYRKSRCLSGADRIKYTTLSCQKSANAYFEKGLTIYISGAKEDANVCDDNVVKFSKHSGYDFDSVVLEIRLLKASKELDENVRFYLSDKQFNDFCDNDLKEIKE